MSAFELAMKTTYVARLHRLASGEPQAAILGHFDVDGRLVPTAGPGTVKAAHGLMTFGKPGTLWAVGLEIDTGGTAASAKAGLMRSGAAINLASESRSDEAFQVELKAQAAKLPDYLKSEDRKPYRIESRSLEQSHAGHSEPDKAPTHYAVTGIPRRLVTALALNATLAEVGAMLTGSGVPFELESAPDYVTIDEGWIRSMDWSVVKGRLHAPLASDARVLELLEVNTGSEVANNSLLGLGIFEPGLAPKFIRFIDWRSDEQVLKDSEKTVRRLIGAREGSDEAAILAALGRLEGPSRREEFEVERLVDVSRRRGRLPRDAAKAIFASSGLDELIEAERAEIRRGMQEQASAEIESEKRRLDAELDAARRSLADAERNLKDIQEREAVASAAELRAREIVAEMVEARMAELTASLANHRPDETPAVEATRQQVEALGQEIDALRKELRQAVATRAESDGASEIAKMGDRVVNVIASTFGDRLAPFGEPGRKGIVANDEALKNLASHAYAAQVELDALLVGFAAAAAGMLPLYVGRRAAAAANALVAAVGGSTHRSLHCDPTLISAHDLFDRRNGRATPVIDGIRAAQATPNLCHGIAMLAVDWAPCSYWLGMLVHKEQPPFALPRNLLFAAAIATAGAKSPIAIDALKHVLPIEPTAWKGSKPCESAEGPWSTDLTSYDKVRDVAFFAEVGERLPSASKATTRTVAMMACFCKSIAGWTCDKTVQQLAICADWLSYVEDDSNPAPSLDALRQYLNQESD